jgi:uncharacterized protein YhaN
MSEHIGADQLDRYADAATAQLRAERDEARRQMQSLTEDYVAMEARAIAAERERDELRRELDARTDPELAERLISHVVNDPHVGGLPQMQSDVHAAARLLGGGE